MNRAVFDFRFAGSAIGVWLGAITCFQFMSKNAAALVLFAGIGFALSLIIKSKRFFLLCLLFGFTITFVRFEMLHKNENAISKLSFKPQVLEVTNDPQLVADRFADSLSFGQNVYLYADVITKSEGIPVALTVEDSSSPIANALPSSRWQCTVKLSPAEPDRRYLAFAECLDEPQKIESATNIQNIAGTFRKSLSSLTYETNPSDAAALLPGLVVGDNSAQSDALVNNLRISGLGHLTAVSGANVAILLLFVQFLLQRTYLSDKWRFTILILVLIAFVIVARPSASVVRAAMMASITLVYWLKGMQKLSEGILFLAVIVLIVVDPWLAVSWGLALSAAATLGLIVLPRYWGVDEKSNLLLKLSSTALAASLATLPILFLMGSPITFATLPANILAEILIGPATILGLIAPLINLLPGLGVFASILANLAVGVAALIVGIAAYFSHSVFAIPIISFKGFLLIALSLLGFKFRKRKFLVLLLAGAIAITFFAADRISSRWQIKDWEIAVCDIGQGDATLIRTAEHSAMLVDSGPDSEAMKECLKLYEVETIDLFVASHFHADHVAGILALNGNLKPKRVITALLNSPDSGVELVEKIVAPVPRENGYLGMSGSFDDSKYQVTWQVLAPLNPLTEISDDDGSLINNNSVVLQVNTNHHQVLLTGDIEIDGQSNLMYSIGQLDVDLVKVPHHGSAYQSPDFAKWVSAGVAWISVGEGNNYGHPNANTILTYQSAGSIVLTTLDCGYISFGSDAYSTSRGCV